MTAFLAIVRLTCRSALRSNIFRTLLFLLLLAVVLIPNTIKGDGTAMGFVQIILEYSLAFVTLILAVSAAWVACSEIASDVESAQLHMIVVKPIPRIMVLLGKFTGVIVIHGILLIISAATVYAFVMLQLTRQSFSEGDQLRLRNEVLTGRRLYKPMRPDFDDLAAKELARRVELARQHGEAVSTQLTGTDRRNTLESMKKGLIGKMGELAAGDVLFWKYEALPDALNNPFFLRYKVFSDSSGSSINQSTTRGAWVIRAVFPMNEDADRNDPKTEFMEQRMAFPPEELITSAVDEFCIQEAIAKAGGVPDDQLKNMPPELLERITRDVLHKNTFEIGFVNYDSEGKTLKFQEADGPYLLIRETGFAANYLRTILVIFLGIASITLIASALAAYFTLPTAVFLTVSYVMMAFFSSYVVNAFKALEGVPLDLTEKIGKTLSGIMVSLMIPLQDFFVTSQLATGQLIEFSTIGRLILFNLVIRGLPLFLLGAWLYHSRELGIAVKR